MSFCQLQALLLIAVVSLVYIASYVPVLSLLQLHDWWSDGTQALGTVKECSETPCAKPTAQLVLNNSIFDTGCPTWPGFQLQDWHERSLFLSFSPSIGCLTYLCQYQRSAISRAYHQQKAYVTETEHLWEFGAKTDTLASKQRPAAAFRYNSGSSVTQVRV